jgi:hypothetical protein
MEGLLDDDDAASAQALFEAAMARGGNDNISDRPAPGAARLSASLPIP